MRPTIVFHIGLEKTGTTSFQRFCSENHEQLLRLGVFYPVRGLASNGVNHAPLAACYLPYRDLTIASRSLRADVVESLRADIARSRPRTVLLSAEHLSSRFHDREVANLARDFADYRCQVAVVVRDHVLRLRSAYAQAIRSGSRLGFEDYCNRMLEPANRYLRYLDTIAPWEHAFGREATRVFFLGSGTDVTDMLRHALIPQAATLSTSRSLWAKRSLGANSTEVLRRVNLILPKSNSRRDGSFNHLKWLLAAAGRHVAHGLLAAFEGSRTTNDLPMNEYGRASLDAIADADRRWLSANYGIQFDAVRAQK